MNSDSSKTPQDSNQIEQSGSLSLQDVYSSSSGTDERPKVRQAALSFIFVTVLLDVLSLALLIPILPTLIEREFLDGDTVRAAQVTGVFATTWALM